MADLETPRDWLALPEFEVPAGEGIVALVSKVGVLAAPSEMVVANGIRGGWTPSDARGQTFLPTATIATSAGARLFRLPLELGEWALECYAFARQGQKPFPSNVRFCRMGRSVEVTLIGGEPSAKVLRPNRPEWLAALAKQNPHQAAITKAIVDAAVRDDVCSICGDQTSCEYRSVAAPTPVSTIRLCDDRHRIQTNQGVTLVALN